MPRSAQGSTAGGVGQPVAGPTEAQVEITGKVVEWYLRLHHMRPDDPGTPRMFCDPVQVGAFAITEAEFEAGTPEALQKLLFAVTMFQKRSDAQILRVLRGLTPDQARELTDHRALSWAAQLDPCPHLHSTAALHHACDVRKEGAPPSATCDAAPANSCQVKRHSMWLKRYAHFGKVPTSAALVVHEAGASDLRELLDRSIAGANSPEDAALQVESALTRAWRVSDKISAMYLSLLADTGLSSLVPPLADKVSARRFVVVDSNVDLFLASIGYQGGPSYDARRSFVQALADQLSCGTHGDRYGLALSPRVVQQAAYLFMSRLNRARLGHDCSNSLDAACARCDPALQQRCFSRPPGGDAAVPKAGIAL